MANEKGMEMARFHVRYGVDGWMVCRSAGWLKGRLVGYEAVQFGFATEEAAALRAELLNQSR